MVVYLTVLGQNEWGLERDFMSKRLGFFCEQEINWGSGVYFVSKRMGLAIYGISQAGGVD